VREIMVPRTQMQVVDLETPSAEVRELVASSPYTRLPVVAGSIDEIIGLLHARDLAVAAARDGGTLDARDHVRPILVVPETTPVDRLLSRFREERQQVAIVLDEYGGTAGMVTISDVLKELVGGWETHDPAQPKPERLPDGRVRLPGDLRLDEAAEWLGQGAELTGDAARVTESVTIGGRVVEAIGHVPDPGDRVVMDDLEIEVERVAHHAVVSVLVARRQPQEKPS
jgi:CBS domain containing-hemolysin-like protein